MRVSDKPASPSVPADDQRPVATFKASLCDWRAQYKARRAARAPAPGKPDDATGPA
jgi:hypothetical protein